MADSDIQQVTRGPATWDGTALSLPTAQADRGIEIWTIGFYTAEAGGQVLFQDGSDVLWGAEISGTGQGDPMLLKSGGVKPLFVTSLGEAFELTSTFTTWGASTVITIGFRYK